MKRVTTKIVRVGNGQGVRIPKAMREQVGLKGKVVFSVEDGALYVRPERKRPSPRR